MLKKTVKITAVAVILVLVYAVCLYAVQDRLIFFPDRDYAGPSAAGTPEFEEYPLVTADGQMIMGWYAKGKADKPAILFFHGNAGQIATFAPHLKAYTAAGYPVFMVEYRGFATSGGKLTEDTMYADAVSAFDFVKERLGHHRIAVFGYSMGTAPAAALSGMRRVEALILAAPFYSLEREVGDKPVPLARMVLKNKLPSYKFVEKYKGPLLIVHGSADKLIRPEHGKDLFALSPSADKAFRPVEGVDHNGLFFDDKNHLIILEWLNDREKKAAKTED